MWRASMHIAPFAQAAGMPATCANGAAHAHMDTHPLLTQNHPLSPRSDPKDGKVGNTGVDKIVSVVLPYIQE